VPASHRGRAVGSLQSAFLVGIAFGPSVGGLLAAPLGLRWPFVIYAAFCAAAATASFTLLPEAGPVPGIQSVEGAEGEPVLAAPAQDRGLRGSWTVVRPLLADRAFVAALLMMAASRWAAQGLRFSLVPVFGQEEVGASVAVVGIGLTVAAVVHLALVWPAGKLADTAGRRALSVPAYLGFALVVAGLILFDTPAGFLVAMALYGVGTGFSSVTPPAMVGDIVPAERAGTGIGVLNTAGDLGSVLGPMISGALAEAFGYGAGFAAAAVLLAVAGVAALRARETLPAP
jgi:MFS transporter, DHA1 family, multidrug resistance protein